MATPQRMPDPDSYFREHVAPLEAELETARQAAARLHYKRRPVAIAVTVAAVAAIAIGFSSLPLPFAIGVVIVCFIAFAIAVAWARSPRMKHSAAQHERVMPIVVRFFGDGFTHAPRPDFDMNRAQLSGLLPGYTRSTLRDHISGTHHTVPLEVISAHLEQRRTSGSGKNRRTYYVTVFHGIAVFLRPPKVPDGWVRIVREPNMVGRAFQFLVTSVAGDGDRVHLEDPTFEAEFRVYASDQVEARRILTPSFMARLLELQEALDGSAITAGFYDRQLFMMVPMRRLPFEPPGALEPVDLRSDFDRFIKEMRLLFTIIDTLRLDNDTGL